MVKLEPNLHGQFFGGDSYVVLYTYQVRGREQYIIYYWLVSSVCLFKYLLKLFREEYPFFISILDHCKQV